MRICEGHSVKYLEGNIQDKRWFGGRNHCSILATLLHSVNVTLSKFMRIKDTTITKDNFQFLPMMYYICSINMGHLFYAYLKEATHGVKTIRSTHLKPCCHNSKLT